MLKTKVKASGITNLTDARYFAAWEVEWLGFCLNPQDEHYIAPKDMNAIKEWVDGVTIVGEFDLQSADDIQSGIDLLNLETIQVGPFTSVETLIELQADIPVIKEIIVATDTTDVDIEEQLDAFSAQAATFLLNFDKNGISWKDIQDGKPVSYDWLKDICDRFPILLSISFPPPEIEQMLSDLNPLGINVVGGEEEKVGYKSFDQLDEIFEELEVLV
ncbi:MAG: hypothetical protein MRY78_08225 [Saprospiraceae bacterium]|nr:hypothetical protein [Saprospiraceae bacterium]